jgi:hypothetical protein
MEWTLMGDKMMNDELFALQRCKGIKEKGPNHEPGKKAPAL